MPKIGLYGLYCTRTFVESGNVNDLVLDVKMVF